MTLIDVFYEGAAVATTTSTGFTAGAPGPGGTFTVASDAGYPVSGKFEVVLDRGLANEEKILVNSRSGTTFTIGARGYDDTTATSHSAGTATVEHTMSATVLQLLVNHQNGAEVDPHAATLLNNARHDIEARHTFGGAYGTPTTPVALTPDIAGAAGSGNNPAREDHVHNVPAGNVSTITGTNSEGSTAFFARADHNHAIGGTNHIPGAAIVDNSITATQIAPDAIGTSELGPDSVTATELATGAVANSADIADAIVTLSKFASEAGTTYGGAGAGAVGPFNNLTLGSGGVTYARHFKLGRLVLVLAGFQLGTGGDLASPALGIDLPFNAANITGFSGNDAAINGFSAARAFNNNTSERVSGTGVVATTECLNFVSAFTSAVWNFASPFDWSDAGAGSKFQSVIIYEATA